MSSSAAAGAPSAQPGPINPDDLRLGDHIKPLRDDDLKTAILKDALVMVGFPYDEGTSRNGGRAGGAKGPETVLQLMPRLGPLVNPEYEISLTKLPMYTLQLMPSDLPLEDAHSRLELQVASVLKLGGTPFVVGGSNDESYANACALMSQYGGKRILVINIDAHLDVRPLKNGKRHSGSPFRCLLEDDRFDKGTSFFVEFASQGSQCSQAHVDYVKANGGQIVWLTRDIRGSGNSAQAVFGDVLKQYSDRVDHIFVSFDIDAIASCDCPGVSAPGVVGLTAHEALAICQTAGRHPKVTLFDASEFNPAAESYRTGRLLVNMFYFFALGLAARHTQTSSS